MLQSSIVYMIFKCILVANFNVHVTNLSQSFHPDLWGQLVSQKVLHSQTPLTVAH